MRVLKQDKGEALWNILQKLWRFIYLNFFMYDAPLTWERSERERGARRTQEEYSITTMILSLHPSFLTLEKWFINPQTKCDSSLLPLTPRSYFPSRTSSLSAIVVQIKVRPHEEGWEDWGSGDLDSSFLPSSLRAMRLEWSALPWLQGRLFWERVIWRLLLNLLQRYYLVEFAMPVLLYGNP